MLSLPASQRPDRPRRSSPGRRGDAGRGRGGRPDRARSGLLGRGLLVASALLAANTLVRVRRLRRTAAHHAGELDHATTIGPTDGVPVRLLVLGDSAARGYGLTDAVDALPGQVARRVADATGRGVAVAAEATDGHRTADVLAEQAPTVAAARPDVVVVGVGVNDAIGRTRDRALAADTVALVAAIRDHAPSAGIVVVTCPDLAAAPGFPWPLGALVGWRCRRVARVQREALEPLRRTDDRLRLVHLPRPDATLFGPDGFHPGAAAHAAMADRVAPQVVDLLAAPPDTSHTKEPAWTSD